MKSHLKIFALSIVLIAFFSSCETDGTTGPGTGGGPIITDEITLELDSGVGLVSVSETLNPGDVFTVRLLAEKGEVDMQAISISENGANLDISRFEASNTSVGANPFTIDASEVSSFSKDITITAPTDAGDYTYTFTIFDVAGNTDSKSVNITINVTPPSITFMGSGMLSSDLGNLVSIPVMATAGSSPLTQIAIYLDGAFVPFEELFIGSEMFPANPAALIGTAQQVFDESILIRTNKVGEAVYTIEVTDEAGEVASVDITVNTGTPVTMIEGALLNSDGPAGQGGLDLDTGNSVGSADATSDIKDEGIDLSQPIDANWLQQISGANGAEIRALIKGENGLTENYSFENIAASEQIEALWSNGSALTMTNSDGDQITDELMGGENFVVFSNSNYYLIAIKDVVATPDNNNDQYVIDIKF